MLIQHTRKLLPVKYFVPALGYKILAGWALGWLYMAYYEGGDTWVYYQNAQVLSNLFSASFTDYLDALAGKHELAGLTLADQPRAIFFAKWASLLSL